MGSGEAIARLVAFIATIYLARTLGATLYGTIGVAAAVLLYLTRIADAGFEIGLGVREIAMAPEHIARLAPSVVTARSAIAGVLAVVVAVVGLAWLPQPDGALIALYGLCLLPVGLGTRWVHLGLERGGLVAAVRTIGELAMVLGVVAIVHGPGDVAAVPLAQFLGDCVIAALLMDRLRQRRLALPVTLDWSILRPLASRGIPLVLSALLGLMIYNSGLIFLRLFSGATAVGYFAAAYALISFLGNLGTAYTLSLLPTFARLGPGSDQQRDLYHTATAQVFAVALPTALGGALLAPEIIRVVFGASYASSGPVLQLLVWSIPLVLVRSVPTVALMAAAREDRLLRTTAWATAVHLALNLLLIPRFGMRGAAGATVATELVRLALAAGHARAEGYARASVRRFWRAGVAGAAMTAILLVAQPLNLWLAIAVGVVTYLAALAAAGGIRLTREGLPALSV